MIVRLRPPRGRLIQVRCKGTSSISTPPPPKPTIESTMEGDRKPSQSDKPPRKMFGRQIFNKLRNAWDETKIVERNMTDAKKALVESIKKREQAQDRDVKDMLESTAQDAIKTAATDLLKTLPKVPQIPTLISMISKPPTALGTPNLDLSRPELLDILSWCAENGNWMVAERLLHRVQSTDMSSNDPEFRRLLIKSYLKDRKVRMAINRTVDDVQRGMLDEECIADVVTLFDVDRLPRYTEAFFTICKILCSPPILDWTCKQDWSVQMVRTSLALSGWEMIPLFSHHVVSGWKSEAKGKVYQQVLNNRVQIMSTVPFLMRNGSRLWSWFFRAWAFNSYVASELDVNAPKGKYSSALLKKNIDLAQSVDRPWFFELAVYMKQSGDVGRMSQYLENFQSHAANQIPYKLVPLQTILVSCAIHFQLCYAHNLSWEPALDNTIALLNTVKDNDRRTPETFQACIEFLVFQQLPENRLKIVKYLAREFKDEPTLEALMDDLTHKRLDYKSSISSFLPL